MFHESSKRMAQPSAQELKRPPHIAPKLWDRATEILSYRSVTNSVDPEASAPILASAEHVAEQPTQDLGIDLSIKGIAAAVAEARRNGDPAGHTPTIY